MFKEESTRTLKDLCNMYAVSWVMSCHGLVIVKAYGITLERGDSFVLRAQSVVEAGIKGRSLARIRRI